MMRRHIALLQTVLFVAAAAVAGSAVAQRTTLGAMGQGTESRMWSGPQLPNPTSPTRYTYQTYEHVKITMRDGIKLDALVYVPNVPTPGPCILVADGYGWSYDSRDRRFAERGYALVNVSMRGIGQTGGVVSEGVAGLYNEMARDGYDVVEWMARQPWCNGKVGAFGSSLPGIPLWQIAREAPPSLKAIAPDVACGNCYEYLWYMGGTLPGPGREDRPVEYQAAIQHRNYDAWWRDQSTLAEDHIRMAQRGFPILATGGWEDYITSGNIQAFDEYARAGGVGRMIISPGAHLDARRAVLGPHHHEQHMDLFFDHYLRGEQNQWTDGTYKGNVLIWVNGPNKYRWEKTWPIPDTRHAKLFLRDVRSGTVASSNDGMLTAAPPAPQQRPFAASYDYHPQTGPFLRVMRQSSQGITRVDQTPFESQVATWTTGRIDAPTEITGKIKLDFWASASAEDTDFVLMVSDVAPDGRSTYLTSGYLNGPRNASRTTPTPLVPGQVQRFTLETQPIAYVVQPGHRIRLSIAGGAERAPEQNSPQGPGKNPTAASVKIYQDADRPSSVLIPVIGTPLLPSEVTDPEACKNHGWRALEFVNQGACVSHVVSSKQAR